MQQCKQRALYLCRSTYCSLLYRYSIYIAYVVLFLLGHTLHFVRPVCFNTAGERTTTNSRKTPRSARATMRPPSNKHSAAAAVPNKPTLEQEKDASPSHRQEEQTTFLLRGTGKQQRTTTRPAGNRLQAIYNNCDDKAINQTSLHQQLCRLDTIFYSLPSLLLYCIRYTSSVVLYVQMNLANNLNAGR